uniref:Activating signal cointegrator 1 complex subunit 1 (Trinotate prediction) n=1 Tax=Henneguya salminicola TaxID=69463 RepID=A0A6G3MDY3_HENSL
MLNLLSDVEKEKIKEEFSITLNRIIQTELKNNQIQIIVEGVDIMNNDPSNVDILYATVKDPSNILQNFVNSIFESFKYHAFANNKLQLDHVKIHISLMKSYFDRSLKSRGFDARYILEVKIKF